jgi:hypothetical protein
MAATAAQVVAETHEVRKAPPRPERGFAQTAGECWLGWFGIGSPRRTLFPKTNGECFRRGFLSVQATGCEMENHALSENLERKVPRRGLGEGCYPPSRYAAVRPIHSA